MNFISQSIRYTGFALSLFLILVNPKESYPSLLPGKPLPKSISKIDIKVQLIGEIVGYSYIKMTLESTDNAKRYKALSIPLRGSYYESISSKTFKIIGSFNTQTLIWKMDCFNEDNLHTSVFMGKENTDGVIEGHWTNTGKKAIRRFYLRKTDK